MKRFNNIQILPYSELLDNPFGKSFHRGGPIWPDWEKQSEVRHKISGRLVDHKPIFLQDSSELPMIDETLYWCGAITGHFGHQITDFTSRIATYRGLTGKLCFSVHPRSNITSFVDCPTFFKEIIYTLGFSADDIFIVSTPILAKTLFCSSQQETLGGGAPNSSYLDILDEINQPLTHNEKSGSYYISRAAQKTGRIAAESYFESYLGLNGFKVIRPESISLSEQIKIYRSAKRLIFSEGSAVHTLQLLGRNPVNVSVLNRRPNTKIAKSMLEPRVKNLAYYDLGQLIYGLNRVGKPAQEMGICLPKFDNVINFFNRNKIDSSGFDRNTFELICIHDIRSWIENEKRSPRSSTESEKCIKEQIINIFGDKSACIL